MRARVLLFAAAILCATGGAARAALPAHVDVRADAIDLYLTEPPLLAAHGNVALSFGHARLRAGAARYDLRRNRIVAVGGIAFSNGGAPLQGAACALDLASGEGTLLRLDGALPATYAFRAGGAVAASATPPEAQAFERRTDRGHQAVRLRAPRGRHAERQRALREGARVDGGRHRAAVAVLPLHVFDEPEFRAEFDAGDLVRSAVRPRRQRRRAARRPPALRHERRTADARPRWSPRRRQPLLSDRIGAADDGGHPVRPRRLPPDHAAARRDADRVGAAGVRRGCVPTAAQRTRDDDDAHRAAERRLSDGRPAPVDARPRDPAHRLLQVRPRRRLRPPAGDAAVAVGHARVARGRLHDANPPRAVRNDAVVVARTSRPRCSTFRASAARAASTVRSRARSAAR